MDHDPLRFANSGRYALPMQASGGGASMIQSGGFGEHWDRLTDLELSAEQVLAGLDGLGIHQAAAYLSMALDVMRRARPDPLPQG